MNNVAKSIGWAQYTINPVKGLCPVGCSYCYARRAYGRNCNKVFRDKTVRFDEDVMWQVMHAKAGSKIFVGSTIDLFGDWVEKWWLESIFEVIGWRRDVTFMFLTKKPENLHKWSPFPVNSYVGVSVTNHRMFHDASYYLQRITAPVRFYSFEPLLEHINLSEPNPYFMGNWIILGRQTPISKKTAPKVEWLKAILQAADKAQTAVFIKNNLRSLLIPEDCRQPNALMDDIFWESNKAKLRQEFPVVTP